MHARARLVFGWVDRVCLVAAGREGWGGMQFASCRNTGWQARSVSNLNSLQRYGSADTDSAQA